MRICISCGAQFEGRENDVIPICPDCRTDPEASVQLDIPTVWLVSKGGKDFELESEGAVREWILQGLILPNDMIVLPDGERVKALSVRAFQEAFRTQRGRQTTSPPSFRNLGRFTFSLRWLLQFFLIALFSTSIAWALYRVARFRPSTSGTNPLRDKWVAQLREQVTPPNRSADVLLDNAKSLLKSDRPEGYEAARRLLEQAITIDPKNGTILGYLTVAYGFSSGLSEAPRFQVTALDVADLAISMQPDRPEGYVARARTALSANNLSVALETCQKGENLFPRDGSILITHAAALLAHAKEPGELLLAVTKATQGLQDDPDFLEGYDIAGMGHFRRGEPEQARSFFEQRMKRAPSDPVAPYRMGLLDERGGNRSAAMEWYQQSLRADSTYVASRLRISQLLRENGSNSAGLERHLRDVITRYRRFAHAYELFEAERMLVRLLLETHRPAEAKDLADQFPALLASTPNFAISRASVLEALGSPTEAMTTLDDLTKSEPNNSELRFALARTQEKYSSVNDALRTYRNTLSLSPNWVLPYFFLARLILQKSEPDEALDVASAVLTKAGLAPTSDLWETDPISPWAPPWAALDRRFSSLVDARETEPTPHALLGLLRLTQGEFEGDMDKIRSALRPFQRARDLAPAQEFPYIYIGRVHFALSEWDAAATAFRQAQKSDPLSSMAHYWLGMTYIKKKKWSDAKAELSISIKDSMWGYRATAALGDVALATKDKGEAITKWRESLQSEPRYMSPWRSLLEATR